MVETIVWDAFLTWCINSSYEPIKAADGHAAISRPTREGPATATLAGQAREVHRDIR